MEILVTTRMCSDLTFSENQKLTQFVAQIQCLFCSKSLTLREKDFHKLLHCGIVIVETCLVLANRR